MPLLSFFRKNAEYSDLSLFIYINVICGSLGLGYRPVISDIVLTYSCVSKLLTALQIYSIGT